jgi:L-ascorbate metabolism protein UlaG (beta-lactamase superfamily)
LTTLEQSDYNDYEKTENYAYVILLNKKRIFHQGDTDLKFNREALSAVKKPLDIAYLSFFDWDSASYSLLKNELQAKNIVFMHGTKPAEELNRDKFKDVKSEILFFDEMEKFILK